ncbi:FG-GAP-like repeat-containing protein [Lysobacter terrae]
MFKRTGLIALALLAASCGQDQSTSVARRDAAGAVGRQAVASPSLGHASAFATLADRGALLAYDRSRKVARSDAATWYPVQLSEDHALNAIASGELVIPAPDGETLRLRYENHVEHSNGNWSWIGRNADGADVVLTFGPKAVFGTITTGDKQLKVTMAAGRAWLVETNLRKVAVSDRSEDFLIPPSLASAAAKQKIAAGAQAEAVGASAATTVDVVLGYTTGLANSLGGSSQAVTRMQNLVDTTNQAYANSQITARIRLVQTVQVNYADATDNGDALSKLTGYESGTGSIPVDPAFTALRAARDQSGADLVSLVRKFQTPQNNGCGIAWLIGGDLQSIDASDAPFAYSVVSDGQDLNETDNKTYFCREETLAHELGHNMGQAHNTEDAGGSPGAHSYSYGYREAATDGFYTVMAYRLASSSQFSIRYFANPNVTYAGRPTGVANAADNVRSMGQTMPIIATFRAQVVPLAGRVRNDLNGDGKSDLIWENVAQGSMAYWWMSGAAPIGSGVYSVGTPYRITATGDFDGDGRADILWANTVNNTLYLWRSRGDGTFDSQYVASYASNWSIAGTADLNGDGKSDLLWEDRTQGMMAYWWMNGATATASGVYSVGTAYRIFATGDFDGDGRGDILWANTVNNTLYSWRSRGDGTFDGQYVASYAPTWGIAGTADLNGDGKSDLLWEERTQGLMAYWWMNGASVTGSGNFAVGTAYSIASLGDFDGDGRGDILWANSTNNTLHLWRSRGDGNFDGQYVASYATGWAPVRKGD